MTPTARPDKPFSTRRPTCSNRPFSTRRGAVTVALLALLGLLGACAPQGGQSSMSFERSADAFPGGSEAALEECYRYALVQDSTRRPASRDIRPVDAIDVVDGKLQGDAENLPDHWYNDTLNACRVYGGSPAIAVGDLNGDGYDDLVKSPNNVWINDTAGGFVLEKLPVGEQGEKDIDGLKIPLLERWSGSPALADLDNDGRDEVLSVVRAGSTSELYQVFSRTDAGWQDRTAELGFSMGKEIIASANAIITFDYDNDGWLDIAIGMAGWYIITEKNRRSGFDSVGMLVLHNEQGRGFRDATDELGIPEAVAAGIGQDIWSGTVSKYWNPHTFVHGFTSGDLDNDGFNDLLVAGDFGTGLMLWNEGGRSFIPDLDDDFTGFAAMGPALSDVNDDGFQDIFVSQIHATPAFSNTCPGGRPCASAEKMGNMWQVSDGPRSFTERALPAGLLAGGWGWGATFVDFDNDGYEELIQAAGMVQALAPTDLGWLFRNDPPHLFQRTDVGSGQRTTVERTKTDSSTPGHHDQWQEVAAASGIDLTSPTGGVVVGDFDRDGRIDIALASGFHAKPILYRNTSSGVGNWLEVIPTTSGDRTALWGAKVSVTFGERTVTRISGSQSQSYMSNGTAKLWFGVGEAKTVKVTIRYADGTEETFDDIETNQSIRLARS